MTENEEKIRQFRRDVEESVHVLRREKTKELHQYCISLGGHYFWDWQSVLRTRVDINLNDFVEVRQCSCCGLREEREIEEEIKPTPTQVLLESPLDIREFARKFMEERGIDPEEQ